MKFVVFDIFNTYDFKVIEQQSLHTSMGLDHKVGPRSYWSKIGFRR